MVESGQRRPPIREKSTRRGEKEMDENAPGHHHEVHVHRPYWRRAHRDWRFWVGVLFIALALVIYISTVDLSMVPRAHHTVPIGQ
jgi:hypothetical protein